MNIRAGLIAARLPQPVPSASPPAFAATYSDTVGDTTEFGIGVCGIPDDPVQFQAYVPASMLNATGTTRAADNRDRHLPRQNRQSRGH